jgi:hypothetical protein
MKTYFKNVKGKKLEQRVASMLRGMDPTTKRMPRSGAIDGLRNDVYTHLPFAIECKNQETINLWDWWDQASAQRKPFKDPVLMVSGDNRPILAVMTIEDWINLVKASKQMQ